MVMIYLFQGLDRIKRTWYNLQSGLVYLKEELLTMSPIKVFMSMFLIGIVATIAAGFIGLSYDPEGAAEEQVGEVAQSSPEELVQSSCIGCHGTDLTGGMGGQAPSLVNLNVGKDEIIDVLKNGRGTMPKGLAVGQEEAVAEYLLSIQQ